MLWCNKSCQYCLEYSPSFIPSERHRPLRFWSCETLTHCIQTFIWLTFLYQYFNKVVGWLTNKSELNPEKEHFLFKLKPSCFLGAYFLRGLVRSRPIQNSWLYGRRSPFLRHTIAIQLPLILFQQTFAVLVHVCKTISKCAGASEHFVDACHTKS